MPTMASVEQDLAQTGGIADNGFRYLRGHRLGGIGGDRRSQGNLQHMYPACNQRARQRHGILQPFDGQHGDDRG